jgi:hypothetical protein
VLVKIYQTGTAVTRCLQDAQFTFPRMSTAMLSQPGGAIIFD